VIPWPENDTLFREQVAIGHEHEAVVADALQRAGLPARTTPKAVRDHYDDRHAFQDECDVVCGPFVIDVKSRSYDFTGPDDFPFTTAMVGRVEAWDRRRIQPMAVVCVSQSLRGMAVVPVESTRGRWLVEAAFDRMRNIDVRNYTCPRELLVPFQQLIDYLVPRC